MFVKPTVKGLTVIHILFHIIHRQKFVYTVYIPYFFTIYCNKL